MNKKYTEKDKKTSITCMQSTIKKLNKFKVHPREVLNDVILRLMSEAEKK